MAADCLQPRPAMAPTSRAPLRHVLALYVACLISSRCGTCADTVYKCRDGDAQGECSGTQCGESDVPGPYVFLAIAATGGLHRGTCAALGYTVRSGTTSQSTPLGPVDTRLFTKPPPQPAVPPPVVDSAALLGRAQFPHTASQPDRPNRTWAVGPHGLQIAGISGLACRGSGRFLAVSDIGVLFELQVDMSAEQSANGGLNVSFLDAHRLMNTTYLDSEGVTACGGVMGGDAQPLIFVSMEDPPRLRRVTNTGQLLAPAGGAHADRLETFLPAFVANQSNMHYNQQLEPLACWQQQQPNPGSSSSGGVGRARNNGGATIFVSTERPLLQDEPLADAANGANNNRLRILAIDAESGTLLRTSLYELETDAGNSGLVALTVLSPKDPPTVRSEEATDGEGDHNGEDEEVVLLAMERAWNSETHVNTVRIFEVHIPWGNISSTDREQDVSDCAALQALHAAGCADLSPLRKHMILDLSDVVIASHPPHEPGGQGGETAAEEGGGQSTGGAARAIAVDNYEGMAVGPRLPDPDGRRTLLVVNDDNFSPQQLPTTFIAFALNPPSPPPPEPEPEPEDPPSAPLPLTLEPVTTLTVPGLGILIGESRGGARGGDNGADGDTSSGHTPGAAAFYGVPYALPPLGARRWAAPGTAMHMSLVAAASLMYSAHPSQDALYIYIYHPPSSTGIDCQHMFDDVSSDYFGYLTACWLTIYIYFFHS